MNTAYHNSHAIKAKYVDRFRAHTAADEVIQGTGYENGHGCFIGCTLDRYDHSGFVSELGVPLWLARLADTLFEAWSDRQTGAQFGLDLLIAIQPGMNLDHVRHAVAIGCHERALLRLVSNDAPYADECRKAIRSVLKLLPTLPTTSAEAARSAVSAARSAEAAWSAAWSAKSAETAAWSAESAQQRADLLSAIRGLA